MRPDRQLSSKIVQARIDQNKDGQLAKDEVPEFLWSRPDPADVGRDNVVTGAEMESRK